MMLGIRCVMLACLACLVSGNARAQEFFIYANEGQSDAKQEQDKFECYGWAKSNTGFDPMAPPTATAPPPKKQAAQGGAGRGALRGLALGTAVGAVRGSGGKQSRAIGAAAGGLVGGMRRSDQRRQGRGRAQGLGAGSGRELPAQSEQLQPGLRRLSRGTRLYRQIAVSERGEPSDQASECTPERVGVLVGGPGLGRYFRWLY